jgi:hypothetical protein
MNDHIKDQDSPIKVLRSKSVAQFLKDMQTSIDFVNQAQKNGSVSRAIFNSVLCVRAFSSANPIFDFNSIHSVKVGNVSRYQSEII